MEEPSDDIPKFAIDFPFMEELENIRDNVPITDWDDQLIGTYPSAQCVQCDFPMTLDDTPVYSPRLRILMEKFAAGLINYLPFRLQLPDGEGEIKGYCIAQYRRRIDCINRKKTKVENDRWEPINEFGDFDFPFMTKIYLSRKKIGEEKLFRIQGSSTNVVIRQDLKESIEKAGITGCVFKEMLATP
jgi:hypothetical protein